jgi:hypothetical protein
VQGRAGLGGVLKELILRNPGVNQQFFVVFEQILRKQSGAVGWMEGIF